MKKRKLNIKAIILLVLSVTLLILGIISIVLLVNTRNEANKHNNGIVEKNA